MFLYRFFSNTRVNLCANANKAEENQTENNEQILQDINKLTEDNANLTSQVADLQVYMFLFFHYFLKDCFLGIYQFIVRFCK